MDALESFPIGDDPTRMHQNRMESARIVSECKRIVYDCPQNRSELCEDRKGMCDDHS